MNPTKKQVDQALANLSRTRMHFEWISDAERHGLPTIDCGGTHPTLDVDTILRASEPDYEPRPLRRSWRWLWLK